MADSIISFLAAMIRYSTPLLFVALGVLVMEVSGIVNMGAEGMMIIGCLTGVVVTHHLNNAWLGGLAAMLVAGLFGLLFGALVLEFRINQTVLGVAFNLVGAGLTTTLNRAFFDGMNAGTTYGSFLGFPIPTYIAIGLVILAWVAMYKMKIGVQMRSVGENPVVVESVGISVKKLRYIACAAGGALVGFGGAFLSTGILSQFTENMTDGRGFIALAAVTFGKYTPFGTLGGVLVFGIGETLSYRLQAGGGAFPYEFALMLPYILTVLALCAFSRNAKDPAALGVPYVKSH
ncbi:ABC transporter permease [uncultured Oscillibacter sp.]|uniref:ABC transporter permease n=1 Tax=uncultured Oscillibacter sp. TaxID=876091 RepID=UPI002611981C|nr:ABC transporter permease [uncultured Oscillibacter sp.]